MTQRGAVFVGCRLIAIYFVVDAAILIGGSLLQYGYMITMPGNSSRMPASPYQMIMQNMGMLAIVRGGTAVLLWAAAGKISRTAANPEDGDDGWHGE
jgi:hypothetical protein